MSTLHEHVRMDRRGVSRRGFLHTVSAGAVGAGAVAGTLSLRELVSLRADELRRQGRSMILLWMAGGPSQFETFDPKPGHDNGGPTGVIDTAVPGIQIAQGWERTAAVMGDLAVVRSMTNREGSHPRATYQLHTGYAPAGSVKHPSIGANLAKQLADPEHPLPSVVSVGGGGPFNSGSGAGFLGVQYEPFLVRQPGQLPENVALPADSDTARYNRRLGLLDRLEDEFADRGAADVVASHRQVYEKTARMVLSPQTKAFDLADEPESLRQQYGETAFGRGCLLARRLVEAGVTFVEVFSPGWDTHQDNFTRTGQLAAQVDPGLAALVADLKDRGRLEQTLVVWMGEFGRTPRVNPRTGRDHYPRAFNAVLAGAGVQGGQVIGRTSEDGSSVADRPVTVPDLFCSVCQAMGVDPRLENISPLGRPLKIVDGGEPVSELF